MKLKIIYKLKSNQNIKSLMDDKFFIGKEVHNTFDLPISSLLIFIERDIEKLKKKSIENKWFSFDFKLEIEHLLDSPVIKINIIEFKSLCKLQYPIFKASYVLRWKNEKDIYTKLNNPFLFRNKERSFSPDFQYLIRSLKDINMKYNFQRPGNEFKDFERRFYTSYKLSDKLKNREIKRILNFDHKNKDNNENNRYQNKTA